MSGRQTLSWRSARQKRRYSRGMDLVEARLQAAAAGYPGALGDACRATLAAGGKRVRPLLTLLCSRRDAELAEPVLRAAASVELLHMATLVHDDILDRAEMRRGRATVAREFGADIAVSSGNFLLARAFTELVGAGDAEAVEVLSAAAVGLSEGEVLQRDDARRLSVTAADYERRCERKTADLFAASCRLGAMLSGLGDEVAAAVAEFGRLIGLAFQVFDDILDLSGDEQAIGKRPGADVRDGTITLPLILALDCRPDLGAILAQDQIDDFGVDLVLEAVGRCGALEGARAVALGYIEQARMVLAGCPDLVERELLNEVAARVVDRYS